MWHLLESIGYIVIIIAVYRFIEKYGFAPLRDKVLDWLGEHFSWVKKIENYIKR